MPRKSNPELQVWCQKKLDEMKEIYAMLAPSGLKRQNTTEKSSAAEAASTPSSKPSSAKPVKKMLAASEEAKQTQKKEKNADPAPEINRSQFWRAKNERALDEYRSLTDSEKLERASKLKTDYEEEARVLKSQNVLAP